MGLVLAEESASAAAPEGLAAEVSRAALAGAGRTALSSGWLHFMASTKTNFLAFLAGVLACSTAAVLFQRSETGCCGGKWPASKGRLISCRARLRPIRQCSPAVARGLARLRALKTRRSLPRLPIRKRISEGRDLYRNILLRLREAVLEYAPLFRRLHLSPEQQDSLTEKLLNRRMIEQAVANTFGSGNYLGIDHWDMDSFKALMAAGCAETDGQIRQDLGPENFQVYQQYVSNLDYHIQINGLAAQLQHTGTPLTDDQADRMAALLAQDQTDTQPLPDSFATDAAAIMGPGQTRALQYFLAAMQARQTILAANRAALAEGKIPSPTAAAMVLNLQH